MYVLLNEINKPLSNLPDMFTSRIPLQKLFPGVRSDTVKWASTREILSPRVANNEGTDQPAHPRSLISTFVIRSLERIIAKLATGEISRF